MHRALVRSEPAHLVVIAPGTKRLSEVRHEIVNLKPYERLGQQGDQFADNAVACSHGKSQPGAGHAGAAVEVRDCKRILGVAVNRVRSYSRPQCEPSILSTNAGDESPAGIKGFLGGELFSDATRPRVRQS